MFRVRSSSTIQVMPCDDTIPHFARVAPSVWEFTPISAPWRDPNDRFTSKKPSLIILCTWTGAQNRYIAKYTEEYQSLFPSTRIMVITTSAKDFCLRGSVSKQQRLRPAVERIARYQASRDASLGRGILLHVFSEGGSNKACELAEAYYNITRTRLPVTATCLDSTPGHPRFRRLCNALNKSLPQIPVVRHMGLFLGGVVLGGFWMTFTHVKGWENNVISKTRRRINDPVHFDLAAPRCYLYSKNDVLISWEDVDQHVAESIFTGTPVRDIIFEGSGHCEHAREHPERYWEAVMATWMDAGPMREKATSTCGNVSQQFEVNFANYRMTL